MTEDVTADYLPVLLDLFCCAGVGSRGYANAGWRVIGVDKDPQPNYPFEFIQADAIDFLGALLMDLEYLLEPRVSLASLAAIHASPPCQRKSRMTNCRPGLAATYPDLIAPVRRLLEATGKPWVIENVEGSDLHEPVWLCGTMFGRELYRHRGFEANWPLTAPEHPPHVIPASKAGHWRPGTIMSVAGHVSPISKAREVMEADWTTRDELAEAIPPYFTEYVGRQLLAVVSERKAA